MVLIWLNCFLFLFAFFSPVFDELGGASWRVILSDFNRGMMGDDGEISLVVEDIIPHPDFEDYHNDIGKRRK